MRAAARVALLSVGVALAVAPAPRADWLVTRLGDRVETSGTWEVQGQQVVFKLPGGALSSLRLSDVDLEESSRVTEASRRRAEAPAERQESLAAEPKEAVFVLTDADVRRFVPESEEEPVEAAEESRLRVTSWQEMDEGDFDGIRIAGRLGNDSAEVIVRTRLEVRLVGADGEAIGTAGAELTATSLSPNTSANFRADFPGIYDYSRVEFLPDGFAVGTAPESPGETSAPEGR